MSAQAKILKKKLKKEKKRVRRLRRQQRQLHCDATDYMNAVVEQTHQQHREANADWRFVRWARGNVPLVGILTGILVILAIAGVLFAYFGPKVTLTAIGSALLVHFIVLRAMKLANPHNHEGQV